MHDLLWAGFMMGWAGARLYDGIRNEPYRRTTYFALAVFFFSAGLGEIFLYPIFDQWIRS